MAGKKKAATKQKTKAGHTKGRSGSQNMALDPATAEIEEACDELDDPLVHLERVRDVRTNLQRLTKADRDGEDGVDKVEKEVRYVAAHYDCWRNDNSMVSVDRPFGVQQYSINYFCMELIFVLREFLLLGFRCAKVVELVFELLRVVKVTPGHEGVPERTLASLFRFSIGHSSCHEDHYERVTEALDHLEPSESPDEYEPSKGGHFRERSILHLASGLLQDADVDSGPVVVPKDSDAEDSGAEDSKAKPAPLRDIKKLLSVRGRVIALLADIASDPMLEDDMRRQASVIALGYVGLPDVDEQLVTGTYAHVLSHFDRLVRLDTLDDRYLAAQFLWCCRQAGLDTSGVDLDGGDRVQVLVSSLANAVSDEHAGELLRGELSEAPAAGHAESFQDALAAARKLNQTDWERFLALVRGFGTTSCPDAYFMAEARVSLVRHEVGEVASVVLEERGSNKQTLDLVLETALAATPSRRHRSGIPVLAYLYERHGSEGRERLERQLRANRDWWLKRFDDFEATRSAAFVSQCLKPTDENGFVNFAGICKLSRTVSQDFATEHLPRICAKLGLKKGYAYKSAPGSSKEHKGLPPMTQGAFLGEDCEQLFPRMMVNLLYSPYKPTNEALADVARDFDSTLQMLLVLHSRVLSQKSLIKIVDRAFKEKALERVRQTIETYGLTGKNVRDSLRALERHLK